MPVDLTEGAIRDALAVLQEWDRDAASDAESALRWMGWEGEGLFPLRRYDVQVFVWYQLPRKWLTTLERKRGAAEALARLLERLGGRAASYADVCSSAETERLLRAWEDEDPAAPRRFRQLLDASGIEPPDTDALSWGSVMGWEEARVRDLLALELEEAIEKSSLAPGEPGFRRRQAELVARALGEPYGNEGLTRLEAVHAERMQRWLECGHTRGSRERRAIVERVAATVARPPGIDKAAARGAVAPALWLLEQTEEGIGLTQTGALNRALVREAVERWPGWWDSELFGPPNREDEVVLLGELHALLRRLRLLRRRGRRISLTARGRALREDPPALLEALVRGLLCGETFAAACAELSAALLLDRAAPDSRSLAAATHPAIVAEGWRASGEPPTERDVAWTIEDFLCAAEAIGLLAAEPSGRFRTRILTPAGRAGLAAGLRARALAPARAV